MKTKIIIEIDCDKKMCGGCDWVYEDVRRDPILGSISHDRCTLFGERIGNKIAMRCDACLEAERI